VEQNSNTCLEIDSLPQNRFFGFEGDADDGPAAAPEEPGQPPFKSPAGSAKAAPPAATEDP